jgi:hypothetical protein
MVGHVNAQITIAVPAHNRFDADQQLRRIEGLLQYIIGAQLERLYPLHNGVLLGQENYRRMVV